MAGLQHTRSASKEIPCKVTPTVVVSHSDMLMAEGEGEGGVEGGVGDRKSVV